MNPFFISAPRRGGLFPAQFLFRFTFYHFDLFFATALSVFISSRRSLGAQIYSLTATEHRKHGIPLPVARPASGEL